MIIQLFYVFFRQFLVFQHDFTPGLEEEGLYRVVGVASKVTKLLNSGLDKRKLEKLNLGWFSTIHLLL